MPVRTDLLVPPLALTSTALTLAYTCPAGKTAIAKWMSITNGTAAAAYLDVAYRSGGVDRFRMWRRDTNANLSQQIELWWVIPAGTSLYLRAQSANALTVGIDGTELDGVAP